MEDGSRVRSKLWSQQSEGSSFYFSIETAGLRTGKAFSVQEAGSKEAKGKEARVADGFSRNVVDVCRGQSGLEWRPLAGHAVTFAFVSLFIFPYKYLAERVEKYTLEGQRKPCVCKEISWKTPRLHGYRQPHGKHRQKQQPLVYTPLPSAYIPIYRTSGVLVFCSFFETSRVEGPVFSILLPYRSFSMTNFHCETDFFWFICRINILLPSVYLQEGLNWFDLLRGDDTCAKEINFKFNPLTLGRRTMERTALLI